MDKPKTKRDLEMLLDMHDRLSNMIGYAEEHRDKLIVRIECEEMRFDVRSMGRVGVEDRIVDESITAWQTELNQINQYLESIGIETDEDTGA